MRTSLIFLAALLAGSPALAQNAPPQNADAPAYSVVEPKAPPKAKPAAKRRAAKANARAFAKAKAKPKARVVASAEPSLKPSGPCVIKPVMSDQDLVNCGATPHH